VEESDVSRVVVADKVAPAGLDVLRRAGHEVVELDGQPREKLIEALRDADALLVRSATKVDRELLEAAPRLTVVGRAGVGVDNVDVPAATARGILVINAPTANVVSAVEHTFALLFALLRRVPAAAASMEAGKWDKSKFVGMELSGKTLGIIGLGQVGSRVAVRARAFEAKVLGFDPYLPPERARELGVPLLPLPELLASSDIVTIHATAGEGGKPILGREELGRMRQGAILVNVARGKLVDREALLEALQSGRLAGAALDVFDPEPPDADDPSRRLPNVVTTPHLGAPTVEAQERVSLQTVEAVAEALTGATYVPAVNLPFRGPADPTGAAAWMRLAERASRFLCCIGPSGLTSLSVETWGLPEDLLRPIRVSLIMGGGFPASADATLFSGKDARIVEVDGLPLEFRPEGTIVFLKNRDGPGVVGKVGTILGDAGVNIADFSLARGEGSKAAAVIAVDSAPSPEVLERLRRAPAIEDVRVVSW